MADVPRHGRTLRALLALAALSAATPGRAQQPGAAPVRDSLQALKTLSLEQLMSVEVTSVSRHPEPQAQAASAIQVITREDIRRSGATSLPEALRLATNLQVLRVDARQWAISARGFTSTTANKLQVMIDGRTVYTPLFSGVFWDVQDPPLQIIDRIEVISGPGATLWGANAVNGVINVITRPAGETQGALVTGGAGTELRGTGTVQYGGAIGPAVRYRVFGKGVSRDAARLPGGGDAGDESHAWRGGFRMDADPSPATRFTLLGSVYTGRIGQQSAGDISVGGGHLLARYAHAISPRSSITAQVYFDRTHRDIPGVFEEDLNTIDVDLQHRVLLGAHAIVWGLGYRLLDDHVGNSAALAFLPPEVTRHEVTGFVQGEISLLPERLRLVLGSKVGHNAYTGLELQPSGRLNWTISPAATLWTAVSRAIRAPSRIDREFYFPGQPPYQIAGGPDFQSEELVAYELGFRGRHQALALSVSTFYNRYDGLRSLEQVNPPAATPMVIGNGQEGESYGVELVGEYRIAPRWRLRAGYTELRVDIRPSAGSSDTTRGSNESHDPDRQLSVGLSADLPGRVTLDGTLRYVAEITNQQVPAYAELDARIGWQPAGQLTLALVGQNLLHRRHTEFGTPAARRQIERGLYGTVEWRF